MSILWGGDDGEDGGEPGGVWGENDLELQEEEDCDDGAHSNISEEGLEVRAYNSLKLSRSSDELLMLPMLLSCLMRSYGS